MDYGIQLGRRFRALKLWFVLRYFGVAGIQARIRHHLNLAKEFASWIDADQNFQRMAPTPFSTICFRANPDDKNDIELNKLNQQLMEAVNATRKVYLSHTKLGDAFVLRMAIGNLKTERRHVELMWQILQDTLREKMKRAAI